MKVVVAVVLAAGCAEQHLESVEQSAEAEFVGMVSSTLGIRTGWTLLDYGCHCGPDSPDDVIWLDDVDNCCRLHDEAYLAAPNKFAGCNCRTQAYAYTVTAGVVTCAAQQVNACAEFCCAEDKKIVECIAGAGPLDNTHASVNRDNACPLAECRADEDCEGGYYCNRGTCRMYCDPGLDIPVTRGLE
jgi:Phospholipase A2